MTIIGITFLLLTYWVIIAVILACAVAWVWGVCLPRSIMKVAIKGVKILKNRMSMVFAGD